MKAALFGQVKGRNTERPGDEAVRSSSASEKGHGVTQCSQASFLLILAQYQSAPDHQAVNLKPVFPDLWKTAICDTPLEPQAIGCVAEHAGLPGLTCRSAMN